MGRSARFVVTLLVLLPPVMSLLPATSVPSLSAALATSMSARKGTSAALSARLDTRGTKVGSCALLRPHMQAIYMIMLYMSACVLGIQF
jgi:hypothetical protein